VTSTGDNSGDEHGGLAGQYEANEEGGLTKDQSGDEPVDQRSRKALNFFEEKRNDRGAGHQTIVVDK
jgi:hypothetical protein